MMSPCIRTLLLMVSICLLSACSGGGGGDDSPSSPPGSSSTDNGSSGDSGGSNGGDSGGSGNTGTTGLLPGDYVSVGNCVPFEGSENAELKIFFLNINDAPYFDELVNNAVYEQFQAIPPFSEYFSHLAFYQLDVGSGEDFNCKGTNQGLNGGDLLQCDDEKIHQEILAQCDVSDINGLIKVAFADSPNGGSAGEVIYVGSNSNLDQETVLEKQTNTVIHEVGHNFGLADFYGGGINKNGDAVEGWPSERSREWRNLDGPGCSKWCNSFKPASEYTQSETSVCPTLTTRDQCVSHNRLEDGDCTKDENGVYQCCAWSETPDDYFGSNCAPVWGTEDIGLDCEAGAGCFYGGAYGNNSWRPVKSWEDSIMYGPDDSTAFDSVSERELRKALTCCASSEDGTAACEDFREEYADFLANEQLWKQRLGSCGVGSAG
ncbi:MULTISPECIES: hypothetical protein [Microbulbifer]|uniref:hypothetical protein n=1 Tax=Microbulbifer TaxID=48073 RepID=UPI001E65D2EB|nr:MULTISPECIES: hypothetical protein [Microbulbifer]UHQ55521.1 hypothetical protein LVE68_00595 [Microbulbifer sp. YPW16]